MHYQFLALLATEPAIEPIESLRLISILGLAAISGPLFIGGLIFLLKTNKGV